MKFEFEGDIPAFKGKSWNERRLLRKEAMKRDPELMPAFQRMAATAAVFGTVTVQVVRMIQPDLSFVVRVAIAGGVAAIIGFVWQGVSITPRIRKALEQ